MKTTKKGSNVWKVALAIFSLVAFSLLEFQVRYNDVLNKLNCIEWVVDAEEEVDSDSDLLGSDFFIESCFLVKQELTIGLISDVSCGNSCIVERFHACPRYIQFNQLRICA